MFDSTNIFFIIIAFIIADYTFDRILDYLNAKNWSLNLPIELIGIYDEEKYNKSRLYDKVNSKFSFFSSSFSLVLILILLFNNGFAIIDGFVNNLFHQVELRTISFFFIIGFASDMLSTPFAIYHTFVIEERFGFNKTTPKTFILDKLKSWILAAILGGGIIYFIVWIYYTTGNHFWYLAWIVTTIFLLFITLFYSSLLVPLFNKQKPLEEGTLKEAIKELANKTNFNLKNIFVIDGSKRSTKANAYFSGFGAKKRIVLYDTLINEHSEQEILAILAHEIGHYKKKHTIFGLVLSILQTGLMLFIVSIFINSPVLSNAIGVAQPNFHIGLLVFGLLFSPISLILGIFSNILSRKFEYQADAYAAKYADADALSLALKKLSVNHLSNLKPHGLDVFINYSHPTLLQRLEALKTNKIN